MKTVRHMGMSIKGALAHKSNIKSLVDCIIVDGVYLRTAQEVERFLTDQLAMGHVVLPMSDECEGFDFVTGCPGHKVTEQEDEDGTE